MCFIFSELKRRQKQEKKALEKAEKEKIAPPKPKKETAAKSAVAEEEISPRVMVPAKILAPIVNTLELIWFLTSRNFINCERKHCWSYEVAVSIRTRTNFTFPRRSKTLSRNITG